MAHSTVVIEYTAENNDAIHVGKNKRDHSDEIQKRLWK